MKKFLLILCTAVCAASIAVTACACSEKTAATAELFGFTLDGVGDTMEIGDVFSLPELTVYDSDAVTYNVGFEIRHGSDVVEPVLGQFVPDDLGEYTITASIVFQGRTKTLTKTVVCVDSTDPVILRNELPESVIVGDEVDLSAAFAGDNSGSVTVEYGVSFNGGAAFKPEGASFTADEVGKYDVTITAVDGAGNDAAAEFSLYARCAPTEFEVESVSDGGALNSFVTYNSAYAAELTKEYVENVTLGSRTGNFMRFSNKTSDGTLINYPFIGIIPRRDKQYYADMLEQYSADYPDISVLIPVYIAGECGLFNVRGGGTDENGWYDKYVYQVDPAENTWCDVRMPLENFVYWFDSLSKQFIHVSCSDREETVFYIGGINVEKGRPAGGEFEVESLDSAQSLESFVTYDSGALANLPMRYIENETLGGRTGNFIGIGNKLSDGTAVVYPWVGIIPRHGKEHYETLLDVYSAQYTNISVVIPVFIDGDSPAISVRGGAMGDAGSWYENYVLDIDPAPRTWYDIKIPLENFIYWFDNLGKQFIHISCAGGIELEFYIGGIYVDKGRTVTELEVESLDSPECLASFTSAEGDVGGVLGMTYIADSVIGGRQGNFIRATNLSSDGTVEYSYPWLGIVPRQSEAAYRALYEKYGAGAEVVIPVYIETDAAQLRVRGGATGDADSWYENYVIDADPTPGAWYDVKIPLENFVYWYDNLSAMFIQVHANGEAFSFCIGSIFVVTGEA